MDFSDPKTREEYEEFALRRMSPVEQADPADKLFEHSPINRDGNAKLNLSCCIGRYVYDDGQFDQLFDNLELAHMTVEASRLSPREQFIDLTIGKLRAAAQNISINPFANNDKDGKQ